MPRVVVKAHAALRHERADGQLFEPACYERELAIGSDAALDEPHMPRAVAVRVHGGVAAQTPSVGFVGHQYTALAIDWYFAIIATSVAGSE